MCLGNNLSTVALNQVLWC